MVKQIKQKNFATFQTNIIKFIDNDDVMCFLLFILATNILWICCLLFQFRQKKLLKKNHFISNYFHPFDDDDNCSVIMMMMMMPKGIKGCLRKRFHYFAVVLVVFFVFENFQVNKV